MVKAVGPELTDGWTDEWTYVRTRVNLYVLAESRDIRGTKKWVLEIICVV